MRKVRQHKMRELDESSNVRERVGVTFPFLKVSQEFQNVILAILLLLREEKGNFSFEMGCEHEQLLKAPK